MNGSIGFANFWSTAALDTCRFHLQNLSTLTGSMAGRSLTVEAPRKPVSRPRVGQFIAASLTNNAGTRNYKLYIPATYDGRPLPLIVMLHGCAQGADDFAAGTRMNAVAEKRRCFVLYPEQSSSASANKCWGWFNPHDCTADQGEASLIAGMVDQVASTYLINRSRIFIAGMSAGGAMAMAMVHAYPGMFAAVGVHSGIPFGAATDLRSALAAMSDGSEVTETTHFHGAPRVPAIVFHGDRDSMVHVRNGDRIIAQLTAYDSSIAIRRNTMPAKNGDRSGPYTRAVHVDQADRVVAEHWILHDGSHAWSGGSSAGSYTCSSGPSASEEMLRFFLQVA